MTATEIRKQLEAARNANIELEVLRRVAAQANIAAATGGVGAVSYDRDPVKHSSGRGAVEQLAIAAADASTAVATAAAQVETALAEATRIISMHPDSAARVVLYNRYILNRRLDEIGNDCGCSTRHVQRLISAAITRLAAGDCSGAA